MNDHQEPYAYDGIQDFFNFWQQQYESEECGSQKINQTIILLSKELDISSND